MRLLATYSLIPTRLALLIQRLYFIIGGRAHGSALPARPYYPFCGPRLFTSDLAEFSDLPLTYSKLFFFF